MMPAGSINAWKCDSCGGLTVAVHVDEGVTPMFLACRRTPGCRGMGTSAGYPPPPIPSHITDLLAWEWFRPTDKWARRKGPEMQEHVRQGGLAIRELTDAGRSVMAARKRPFRLVDNGSDRA